MNDSIFRVFYQDDHSLTKGIFNFKKKIHILTNYLKYLAVL